jgi:hypothetical protein
LGVLGISAGFPGFVFARLNGCKSFVVISFREKQPGLLWIFLKAGERCADMDVRRPAEDLRDGAKRLMIFRFTVAGEERPAGFLGIKVV